MVNQSAYFRTNAKNQTMHKLQFHNNAFVRHSYRNLLSKGKISFYIPQTMSSVVLTFF